MPRVTEGALGPIATALVYVVVSVELR